MYLFLFFLFKQKTAYEMRISDWSSDVCSSDLRDEFVESETRRADMIANIAPEILDMIVLSVMRNAVLRCSLIARILIGLGPRLDNREHQDRKTARAKYPIHLPKRLSLIHMFQNMAANYDIK